MKGTNVDGVYDCHSQDSNVTFEHITFQDLASRGLTSMDTMALNFCEENSIPGQELFLSFYHSLSILGYSVQYLDQTV